jgi:hypothetical protein
VEAKGHAIDGRPRRDVVGDVKSDDAAVKGIAPHTARFAREEGGTGAIADVANNTLVQSVVLAGIENDCRGHDPSFEEFD